MQDCLSSTTTATPAAGMEIWQSYTARGTAALVVDTDYNNITPLSTHDLNYASCLFRNTL